MSENEKMDEKSIELFPGYKEFKLEDYPNTELGWDLLKIILDEVREPFTQHIPNPQAASGSYVAPTIEVTRYVRFKKHRYLFGRSQNNAIAAYEERFHQAVERWREGKRELEAALKALHEAKKCIDDHAEKIKQQSATNESLRRQLERAEQTNHNMEATLAKLRGALGTLRFDEITK